MRSYDSVVLSEDEVDLIRVGLYAERIGSVTLGESNVDDMEVSFVRDAIDDDDAAPIAVGGSEGGGGLGVGDGRGHGVGSVGGVVDRSSNGLRGLGSRMDIHFRSYAF